MHANNETGSLNDIREIARIAREAGVLSHTDASQSVGKVRLQFVNACLRAQTPSCERYIYSKHVHVHVFVHTHVYVYV